MAYTQKRFVPGGFVGQGQFQRREKPHWAMLNGSWTTPPPQNNNAGFHQMPNPPQAIMGPGGNQLSPAVQQGIMNGLGNKQQAYGAMDQMPPSRGPGGVQAGTSSQVTPQDPSLVPFQPGAPTLVDMRKQLAMMNLLQMLARVGKHAVVHSGAHGS